MKEIKFDEGRRGVFDAREMEAHTGAGPTAVQQPVQLAKLMPLLKQMLIKLGLITNLTKEFAASTATALQEVALGVEIRSRVELKSAAVRLNSKLELTTKRLKALHEAVQRFESEPMEPAQFGCLVRDHLVPSQTPASTPVARRSRAPRAENEPQATEEAGAEVDSASTSASETDSSDEGEPQPRKKGVLKKGPAGKRKRAAEESGEETEAEDRERPGRKGTLRLSSGPLRHEGWSRCRLQQSFLKK